jgi:hypothetical protein
MTVEGTVGISTCLIFPFIFPSIHFIHFLYFTSSESRRGCEDQPGKQEDGKAAQVEERRRKEEQRPRLLFI